MIPSYIAFAAVVLFLARFAIKQFASKRNGVASQESFTTWQSYIYSFWLASYSQIRSRILFTEFPAITFRHRFFITWAEAHPRTLSMFYGAYSTLRLVITWSISFKIWFRKNSFVSLSLADSCA